MVLYINGQGKNEDAGPGGPIEKLVKSGRSVLAVDLRGTGETQNTSQSKFGNVALGYDQGGFSGRLSVFLRVIYLTIVSITGLSDTFQKGYAKWDIALKQEIPKLKMAVMLNITNLSNFYEGTYWGFQGLDNGSVTYDMLIDLAIRITL